VRKLLHIAATLAILAVLAGACGGASRRCSETTTRNDGANGSYDYHYSRTCVDTPAK
jgi:hypothetical protein